jgi:hypothetical protein
MPITPDKIRHNAFSENLKTDFIAVDASGNILTRASTEAAARHAAPDADAIFTGKDLTHGHKARPEQATHDDALAKVVKQIDPAVLEDYKAPETPVAETATPIDLPDAPAPAETIPVAHFPVTAEQPETGTFDHDGDGKPGGSRPKGNRQRKPAA